MASCDTNQWCQITIDPLFGLSMVGRQSDPSKLAATVLFQATNASHPAQRWQLFPTGNDTYILRSKASSPGSYLAINQDAKSDVKTSTGQAVMRNRDTAADEVFWTIGTFKNRGFKLKNVAYGANRNLHIENATADTKLTMTNLATGDRDDERFYFTPHSDSGKINNVQFSSIQLPNGAYVTASEYSSPTASVPPAASSKGPTSSKKAAIGGSVGAAALIILAVVAGMLICLRRRRRKHTVPEDAHHYEKVELDAVQRNYGAEVPGAPVQAKYGHNELQTEELAQELEGRTRIPVELPAEETQRKSAVR